MPTIINFSLLSSATAQKYGIDAIELALKMANSEKEKAAQTTTTDSTSSNNGITALFIVLPDASDENIAGINDAITIMEKIPEGVRTSADTFKLTMLHTASLGLTTKKFDIDGDGKISQSEILTMTAGDATSILDSLLSAESLVAAAGAAGTGDSAASIANISSIREAISSSSGTTDQEKLTNYLATKNQTPSP